MRMICNNWIAQLDRISKEQAGLIAKQSKRQSSLDRLRFFPYQRGCLEDMSISLYGGPFDGAITEGLSHLPAYMIATNHCDHPIYKKVCGCKTQSNHKLVPYVFVGYESQSHIWSDQNLYQMELN